MSRLALSRICRDALCSEVFLRGKRTRRLRVGETQVRILSLNDLIEMKRQSARPQDLEDIAALERLR
jgi:hypothetical protein